MHHSLGSCSSFGELALLYAAPRAATVKSITSGKLWVMDRAVYMAIKLAYMQQVATEKRSLLSLVPMLAVLSPVRNKLVLLFLANLPRFRRCSADIAELLCQSSFIDRADRLLITDCALKQPLGGLYSAKTFREPSLNEFNSRCQSWNGLCLPSSCAILPWPSMLMN